MQCNLITNKMTTTTITKFNNPYKVSVTGSGWYLFKVNTTTNEYEKVQGFGGRDGGRIMALELMFQLNGWRLPAGGLR